LHSLRSRLLGLWVLSLAACVAVGVLLVQLYQQSTSAQVGRAQAVVARACGPTPPLTDQGLQRDLTAAVTLAIARQDGVEGGIWQAEAGPLAYAFPTYQGTGVLATARQSPPYGIPMGKPEIPVTAFGVLLIVSSKV
jgi:hypothetical protein